MTTSASGNSSETFVSRGYLQWRCRRGMKELDVMLVRFLEQNFEQMDARQRANFNRFLDEPDTRIWQWLLGREQPPVEAYRDFVERIRTLS